MLATLGFVALIVALTAVSMRHEVRRRSESEESRVRRLLSQTVRSSIAKAKEGLTVKIFGHVRSAGGSLEAPLTGEPCVLYDVQTEVLTRRGTWETELVDRKALEFYVEDASGRALIRTSRPEVFLVRDRYVESRALGEDGAIAGRYLSSHGLGQAPDPTERQISEGKIEEGESVVVLGVGRWERDPNPDPHRAGDYRNTPRILVLEDVGDLALVISDDPDAFG